MSPFKYVTFFVFVIIALAFFLYPPSLRADVFTNPHLYQRSTEIFSLAIHSNRFIINEYPRPDSRNSVFNNSQGTKINLTVPETGIGWRIDPYYISYNAQDGYGYEVNLTRSNRYTDLNFIFNYLNEKNYQMLSCQEWTCTYHQLKAGREITSGDLQIIFPTYEQFDGPVRMSVRLMFNHQAVRLQFSQYDVGTIVSYYNQQAATLNLRDPRYFQEQVGEFLVFDYLPADSLAPLPYGNLYYVISKDNYFLTNDPTKAVFIQHHPEWSADQLGGSRYTIGSHGCALTSAATNLRQLGHQRINFGTTSDQFYGRTLNPRVLNQWLQKQPDGYLGNEKSYLNWLAVSRFARLNVEASCLPAKIEVGECALSKFEFQSLENQDFASVLDQDLTQRQLTIVKIKGAYAGEHFLVMTSGTDPDYWPPKYRMADPWYSGTPFFDYHPQNNRQLAGLRRFVPSHTDLSYWLFYSSNPGLELTAQLLDTGAQLSFTMIDDQVTDPQTGQKMAPLYQYLLAKPETGLYNLHLHNPTTQSAEIVGLLYDQRAELVFNNQAEPWTIPAHETLSWTGQYEKAGTVAVTFEPLVVTGNDGHLPLHWQNLVAFIDQGYQDGKIMTYVYDLLKRQIDGLVNLPAPLRRADFFIRYYRRLQDIVQVFDSYDRQFYDAGEIVRPRIDFALAQEILTLLGDRLFTDPD